MYMCLGGGVNTRLWFWYLNVKICYYKKKIYISIDVILNKILNKLINQYFFIIFQSFILLIHFVMQIRKTSNFFFTYIVIACVKFITRKLIYFAFSFLLATHWVNFINVISSYEKEKRLFLNKLLVFLFPESLWQSIASNIYCFSLAWLIVDQWSIQWNVVNI